MSFRLVLEMRLLLLLLLWATPVGATSPDDCHVETACQLGARSYHVKAPDAWDGITPLPVLLHFHGWQRSGALIVKHRRISGASRKRGVLLLAPNGNRRTWDFWSSDTDDVGFAAAVIEDAAKRWPIDRSKIYVSGYSYGAAMAWRYACENGAGVRALLAISGTLDQDEFCPTGPVEVRHVHGLSDNVLDFPFGPNGERDFPVALWRDRFNCNDASQPSTYAPRSWLPLERTTWRDCDKNHSVSLDIHKGGHLIPRGWIAHQLDELLASD